MPKKNYITRTVSAEEAEILKTMSSDPGSADATRKRATAVLTYIQTGDPGAASQAAGIGAGAVRDYLRKFNEQGLEALIAVMAPRGGDFLARYDQGYWAERLVTVYLERSSQYRPLPYGTSRSEPFTDRATFRKYAISEMYLQAWSAGKVWKRPDLLLLPKSYLTDVGGNDIWNPDLIHKDNSRCQPFVQAATAAIEVETSLWQVKVAKVPLSFTVKDEDLGPIRNWILPFGKPLYVVQVFYDQAYALSFARLEFLISDTRLMHKI